MNFPALAPFAVLTLERDPLGLGDLPNLVMVWVQDVGGFAAVGLLVYLLSALLNRPAPGSASRADPWLPAVLGLAGVAAVFYVITLGVYGVELATAPPLPPNPDGKPVTLPPSPLRYWRELASVVGGFCAVLAAALPFLADLGRWRWRRIWALSRLSFQEAVRRRVLWVFLAFLLIFLFPAKWFFRIKPEDEIRTSIDVAYTAMTILLLAVAGLLASFSLPTDIRTQTIHTIVTKPVEKFEIVLGRFLGYAALMTAVLFSLTLVTLLLIEASNPSQEARVESMRSRVPIYGVLRFENLKAGEGSVGREWEYRTYIAGGPRSNQRAVWNYADGVLPAALAALPDGVPCEFSFDIFRTTKGVENEGVFCTLFFQAHQWDLNADPKLKERYDKEAEGLDRKAQPGHRDWPKWEALAEKYGYYEFPSKEVVDYQTFEVKTPAGLYKKALADKVPAGLGPDGLPKPRLQIKVKCESRTQFLGVARRDLYIRAADTSFAFNVFKGAVGLWLRLCVVTAVSVACSTYLSGVISFLVTMFLFVGGIFQEFIQELANGTNVGGGPMESLVRLVTNKNLTIPVDTTPATKVALLLDGAYQWLFARVLNLLPDVNRFNWAENVAEGFDVPVSELAVNGVVLFGYLFPWAVLAYYLMKSREVASS